MAFMVIDITEPAYEIDCESNKNLYLFQEKSDIRVMWNNEEIMTLLYGRKSVNKAQEANDASSYMMNWLADGMFWLADGIFWLADGMFWLADGIFCSASALSLKEVSFHWISQNYVKSVTDWMTDEPTCLYKWE